MREPLRSPSGQITVHTTERGLPVSIKLDQRELKSAPAQLAQDILSLCQLAGMRAQVSLRRELTARGFNAAALAPMRLSTEEELATAEATVFGDGSDMTSGEPI